MEQKYELYHHGILGMHWGIRRYQNPDGSLTPAGKRRYSKDLYEKIKRTSHYESYDSVKKKFEDDDAIRGIRNHPEVVKARERLNNTEWKGNYDRIYSREEERKIEKKAEELASRAIKGLDPDEYDYEDMVVEFHDEAAKQLGLFKAPSQSNKEWESALDAYNVSMKKAVNDVLGRYANKKVNSLNGYGTEKVKNVVYDIILRYSDKEG